MARRALRLNRPQGPVLFRRQPPSQALNSPVGATMTLAVPFLRMAHDSGAPTGCSTATPGLSPIGRSFLSPTTVAVLSLVTSLPVETPKKRLAAPSIPQRIILAVVSHYCSLFSQLENLVLLQLHPSLLSF